jgi:hypothetical protein
VRELGTFRRELVHASGVSATKDATSVATQLTHAEVIDVKEQDVRFFGRH